MTNKGVDHHFTNTHKHTKNVVTYLMEGVASSKLVEASFKAIDIESYLTFIQFHK